MNFKEYLQEDTSRAIWSWMKAWRIPLSPKFMAEVFPENNNLYCFRAIKPERVSSLWRRQKSKNQVSTFVDWKDDTIFFGAGSFRWEEDITIVAVLKGSVTMRGTVDMWTFPDSQGRRWIDVKNIIKYNTTFTDVLNDVVNYIKQNYPKKVQKLDLNYDYHVTPKGNMVYKLDKSDDSLSKKDKNKLITAYIDTSYEALKKFKSKIQKASDEKLAPKAHYNEYTCYDYTIIELIIYATENNPKLEPLLEELDSKKIKYKVVDSTEQLNKELKKYK